MSRRWLAPLILCCLAISLLVEAAPRSTTASSRRTTVRTTTPRTTTARSSRTTRTTRNPATRPTEPPAPPKPPVAKPPAAPAASTPTKEQKLDPNAQVLLKKLALLREVWQRQITLQYLADKRSVAFLEKLLADFSPELKKNFVSNIKGDYRMEFLANYASKMEELTKQSVDLMKDKPQLDAVYVTVLQKSPFPLDQGLAPIAKPILAARTFQATQAGEKPVAAPLKKLVEIWKKIIEDLAANAKKDRYDDVAALYKDVELKDFPIHWYDDAQHDTTFETEGDNPTAPKPGQRKPWTILAYICADNDLERFGLQDINEMEAVGSSDKVNIVAQVDRMRGGKGDTISDGNWTGARRYYVTKDDDRAKIKSQMVMNLGEVDMGNKKTLADFLSWGVETYPADNVVVVIWNHGMGWMGVASDEESGKYMRVTDVGVALREAKKTLDKVNGKASKFAIVDFDACLMGTIETAYELADTTDFLVASEETEPGTGMPYAEYLEPLVRNPALSVREFTKRMVGTYVYSYAKGGSATNPVIQGSPVTKSAVDLARVDALVKLFDQLGKGLLKHHDVYAELLVNEAGQIASIRRYSDETLVDIVDLAVKIAAIPDLPAEIRTPCLEIMKLIGYPVEKDRLAQPVIITSAEPGAIIWGFNNWRMPPKELWPPQTRVFRSRLAMTPLRKLKDLGFFTTIGPFQPVIDEGLQKKVYVDSIDFQVITQDGKLSDKRSIRQGKEYLIVSKFPETSPIVIEGHTQGMGDSRGLSVYFPPAVKFATSYQALRFAKETAWDDFLAAIPEFKRNADILLTGQMVEDPMTLPSIAKALDDNKVKFQVLWDPSVFGYQFKKILSQFAGKGLVISDSVAASSMGQTSPSSDDLIDYLNKGGSLLVAAQSFEQNNVHRDLLKDWFRFTYVDDEKDLGELTCQTLKNEKLTFTLNGDDSANTADDITIMKTVSPGKLFVTLGEGRGAAISIAQGGNGGKHYSAIFLGFRFEAVSGEEKRAALMSEILDRLYPERHQGTLFD